VHILGSFNQYTTVLLESDNDISSSRKRWWTLSAWKHYNIKDGKFFADGTPCAYCKYCNGGCTNVDSSNGMSNFRRHSKTYSTHSSGNVGKL